MTKYHGGKTRIGFNIAKCIYDVCESVDMDIKGYCEPFCGMCGVFQHIPELFEPKYSLNYIASDINESVIKMWDALKRGWAPPRECTREQFYALKGDGNSTAEKGFLGHACAFRGIYFATYYDKHNIVNERRKVIDRVSKLKHVVFDVCSYDTYTNLFNHVIYCDPPYYNHSRYINEYNKYRTFDSENFYSWVNKISENNLVFLSERADIPYHKLKDFKDNEKLYVVKNKTLKTRLSECKWRDTMAVKSS